jgi:hypothetical protein
MFHPNAGSRRWDGKREERGRFEGIRTWTLDALRAATEPVKEEAMQAILLLVLLCVCCVKRVLEVAIVKRREQLLCDISDFRIPNGKSKPLRAPRINFPRSDWPRCNRGNRLSK